MNATHHSSGYVITRAVYKAVEDAQFLVAYAANKAGVQVEQPVLEALVGAKYALDQQQWSAEKETAFWNALKQITNQVSPVTVDSVKASFPSKQGSFIHRLWGSSEARRAAKLYIGFITCVLFALLVIQIYWVFGSNLTGSLEKLLQEAEKLSAQVSQERQEIASTIEILAGIDGEKLDEAKKMQRVEQTLSDIIFLDKELRDILARLDGNATALIAWIKPWQLIADGPVLDQFRQSSIQTIPDDLRHINSLKQKIEGLRNDDESIASNEPLLNVTPGQAATAGNGIPCPEGSTSHIDCRLIVAASQIKNIENAAREAKLAKDFILPILEGYFLPLLYGALGAGMFILRSLAHEIETVTYSSGSAIKYLLRLAMGTLAGLMIGWFSAIFLSGLSGETTILGAIPKFAIAFLVGYNVDVLFSLLDRMIANFSKT